MNYDYLTLKGSLGFFISILPNDYIEYASHPIDAKKFASKEEVAKYLLSLRNEQREILLKEKLRVVGINVQNSH
jgi:hypothetical protein